MIWPMKVDVIRCPAHVTRNAPVRRAVRGSLAALGSSLLAVVLSACGAVASPGVATSGEPTGLATSSASEAQQAAMADGKVTVDEYDAGFRRYSACMATAGFDVIVTGRERDLIEFSYNSAADANGSQIKCYGSEFEQIDIEWQMAHRDNSKNTEYLRECLIKHGITPGATADEIEKQVLDNQLIGKC